MGRVNRAGNAFVGTKTEVTSDVLRAVIEKAEFHGGSFVIEGADERWIVTVAKVSKASDGYPQCDGEDSYE